MKKAALLLTILCLVLFTTGCTSSSGRNQEDSTGTLYSTQNTEKDDSNAPSTRTPEPDICSVCNDEGYLDCEVCGHRGFTQCDLCSGEGQRTCPTCNGNKYRVCGACNGEGGKTCISCNGTGIFGDEYTLIHGKCMMCSGTGISSCAYCSGTGKDACICSGTGVIQCKDCHGDGGFLCAACQGEGRILCSHCQEKTEQPSNQASGGGNGWYDNGIYDSPVSTPSWSHNSASQCWICHGDGVCNSCEGSGRSEFYPDWAGNSCRTCDGSGRCAACGGTGYIS